MCYYQPRLSDRQRGRAWRQKGAIQRKAISHTLHCAWYASDPCVKRVEDGAPRFRPHAASHSTLSIVLSSSWTPVSKLSMACMAQEGPRNSYIKLSFGVFGDAKILGQSRELPAHLTTPTLPSLSRHAGSHSFAPLCRAGDALFATAGRFATAPPRRRRHSFQARLSRFRLLLLHHLAFQESQLVHGPSL